MDRCRFRSKVVPSVGASHRCCMCVCSGLKGTGSHRLPLLFNHSLATLWAPLGPHGVGGRSVVRFNTCINICTFGSNAGPTARVCPRCLSGGQGDNRRWGDATHFIETDCTSSHRLSPSSPHGSAIRDGQGRFRESVLRIDVASVVRWCRLSGPVIDVVCVYVLGSRIRAAIGSRCISITL